MAALNYFFKMADGGDNGSGPYTLTIEKNSSTGFSGGTAITANVPSNSLGTLNPVELLSYAQEAMLNNIAAANQSDPLN